MNLIKKILSIIVLFVLLINISVVNAQGSVYKQLILAKNELQNTKGGAKYIKQVDQLIEKYKNNVEVLQKLKSRTDELLIKLENDKTIKKQLILYINAKSDIALANLQENNEDELIYEDDYYYDDENIDSIKNEIEVSDDDIKEMLTTTVSKTDEEKLNTELVKIQLNLLEKGTKSLETLTQEFEKIANYEEKGNFNMSLNVNQEQFGKLDANFKFSDYTSSNSNFDSQLKGKLEAVINGAIKGEEEFKLQLSSFIDFISKDGNMYLLLKDLNVSENTVEEIKTNIEKLQEIAKQNKYIKFSDNDSAEAIAILKTLTPSKILSEGKIILSQPMFKAYKKVGDKYYLVPTKYGCDKTKELMNKFDPINGTTCSEGQYKDLLKKMVKTGSIYMILGENNTLGFEGITNNEIEKLEGKIVFSDTNIEKINLTVLANQEKATNEGLILDYIRNNKLSFELYGEEGEIDYKLNSTLDSNNKFTYIDFKGLTKDSYSDFKIDLKLQDNQIKGSFANNNSRYDYKTGKYIKADTNSGEISGSTDYSNKLQDLNISLKGIDNENKQFGKANFAYLNNKITFTENYERNGSKIDLLISGTRNSQQKLITDGNFSLILATQESTWDDKNYKYNYSGDYKEIVNSKINIANKIITGTTIIKDKDGKELLNISHTGNYDKKYFKLNNKFEDKGLYNSLSGYSADARNAKRASDLTSINSSLNVKLTEGMNVASAVIQDEEYKGDNIIVGGKKLIYGEDYFAGTVNYTALEMKWDDFLDPDGSSYIIGTTLKGGGAYQLLSLFEKDGNYVAHVTGTYKKRDKTTFKKGTDYTIISEKVVRLSNIKKAGFIKWSDTLSNNEVLKISSDGLTITFKNKVGDSLTLEAESDGLIAIDGKIVIDGAIIGKVNTVEEKVMTSNGNLNFEFDSRDNKGNVNIYFDFILNNEKVINFDLNNTSTIEYKKVEIKEPDEKNTIDSSELEEVFDNYNY